MLVLTRRQGDSVVIHVEGRAIRVVVSKIQENRVRLAFDGPRDVVVMREELGRQVPVGAGEEDDA